MKMPMPLIAIFFLLMTGFFSSCATTESGKYVQLKQGETLELVSKRYKVPVWKIRESNEGKSLSSGNWIFIPMDAGFIGRNFENSHSLTRESQAYRQHLGKRLLWPIPSSKRVTSYYGKRWGKKHEGIDIAAKMGAHILAIDDGVVIYTGKGLGGYGNLTVLSHHNGLFSVYAHQKKCFIQKGQKIHRGQVIGQVGQTGRATGPHLHFELRRESRALDPLQYMALK